MSHQIYASQPETEVQKEALGDVRMPPKPVRPREVPFRVSAPTSTRPPSQRLSTPLEPMATIAREQTGLYTSVEEGEDQTLEGFKSMSILDSNDACDSSSLNI